MVLFRMGALACGASKLCGATVVAVANPGDVELGMAPMVVMAACTMLIWLLLLSSWRTVCSVGAEENPVRCC